MYTSTLPPLVAMYGWPSFAFLLLQLASGGVGNYNHD
jgi:hypothetical protein